MPRALSLLLRALASVLGAYLLYRLTAGLVAGALPISMQKRPVTLRDPLVLALAVLCFYPPALWLLLAGLRPALFTRNGFVRVVLVSVGTTFVAYLTLIALL